MNWEKEYEHLRDRGKTWGPGIDDAVEPTEEEIARQKALMDAYRQKLKEYSVEPRKKFADAGDALRAEPAPSSTDGGALLAWQRKYNDATLALCKSAAESLGYSLERGWVRNHKDANKERDLFSVSIEYCGWIPGEYGNLHKFFVCGIEDVEDCLQLVADFAAIGNTPTTWYREHFHYTCGNSGEVRNELMRRFDTGHPGDSPAPRKEEHQVRVGEDEIAALGARGAARTKEHAQASFRDLDSVIESAECRSNASREVGSVKGLDRDKDL